MPRPIPPRAAPPGATVTLAFDVPADKARRLHALARARGVSIAVLLDEFATMALYDASLCTAADPPARLGPER